MIKEDKKDFWDTIFVRSQLSITGLWQGNGEFIQLWGPNVIYTPLSSLISQVIYTFTRLILFFDGGLNAMI